MKIVYKSLDEIMPYEFNPRNNDEAVDYVANSIKEYGFNQPIVIDAAGVIVAGHTRYRAAQKLELKEVPCLMKDDLTPYQIKAYRLADNKTAEFSEWDYSLLEKELQELEDIDMSEFGFDEELNNLESSESNDDLNIDIETQTVIVIECDNETELEHTFEKLLNEGYQCRLLTL